MLTIAEIIQIEKARVARSHDDGLLNLILYPYSKRVLISFDRS
jgi:hypothetical protein